MFSNPLYLFALAGLSIPIAIHLLSRKEGKIVKVGSVRHIVETNTQQFKGIKLNEIILLLLRCAMIVVFSLLLGGLQCSNPGKEKWAIVEKGLDGLPNLNSVLDSLEKEGYALHLLAKGFPDLQDSTTNAEINYWQLAEDRKIKTLSEAIVFSKNNINHFNGMRSPLPSNVRWISQPTPPANFAIQATPVGRDSVSLRMGHTSFDKTYFTTERISVNASPIATTPQDTIKIVLVVDDAFHQDRKIFKAALLAIEKFSTAKITLTETDPSKVSLNPTGWCVWLSSKKLDGINAKIIRVDPQTSNELIVQTQSNQWTITKRLNQEVALHSNFTIQLATLLLSEKGLQEKISLNDRRMISDSLAWSHPRKEIQAAIQSEEADKYLIILLIALLIIERILAYQRKQ